MANQKHNPSLKVKYTLGPWKIGGKDEGSTHQHVETLDGRTVAYVNGQMAGGRPNAHLIAAAPELLEACYKSLANFEDLLRLHGGILDQELALNIHGAHRALKQAIAKAEGGE